MKKAWLFLLMFTAILNAQNIKSNGTHFVDVVKDKKWSNTNGKDFTNASFSSFSGSCYVLLEVDETTQVSFTTITKVKKGRIEIKLIDESEQTYFYCNTNDVCQNLKDITLEKSKKYRLYFTGTNANGSYKVNWKIKKNK